MQHLTVLKKNSNLGFEPPLLALESSGAYDQQKPVDFTVMLESFNVYKSS